VQRCAREGALVVGADLNPPARHPNLPSGVPESRSRSSTFATKALPPRSSRRSWGARRSRRRHRGGVAGGGPVTWWVRRMGTSHRHQLEGDLSHRQARGHGDDRPGPDRRRRGSIVTIASVEGLEGTAGGSAYNAFEGRCRAAHQEHGDRLRRSRRARQLCVPGLHRTRRSSAECSSATAWRGSRRDRAGSTACAASGGRGDRECRVVLVVARKASFVTGVAAAVDGGTPPAAIIGVTAMIGL